MSGEWRTEMEGVGSWGYDDVPMCAMNMSLRSVDSRLTLQSKFRPPGAMPPCSSTTCNAVSDWFFSHHSFCSIAASGLWSFSHHSFCSIAASGFLVVLVVVCCCVAVSLFTLKYHLIVLLNQNSKTERGPERSCRINKQGS